MNLNPIPKLILSTIDTVHHNVIQETILFNFPFMQRKISVRHFLGLADGVGVAVLVGLVGIHLFALPIHALGMRNIARVFVTEK